MALSTACLEKLEEFVNQEDRIVTYKWFSQKTGISVTSAKQALELFVKHCRSSNVPFAVHTTHLVIGGETKANGQKVTHVCVVDEDQLEAVRSSLKPAGSSHVYSVQKAKIKDASALYAVDVDQRNEKWRSSNKYSSISCPMAVCGKVNAPVARPQPSKASSSEVKTTAATTSAVGTDDSSVPFTKNEAPAAPAAPATSSKAAAADGKGKAARGKQPSAASFFGAASTKKTTKPKAEPVKEQSSPTGADSASAVTSSSPPAATAGKAEVNKADKEVKKEEKEVKKEEKAPSKQTSFFGERLPKKKPETKETSSAVEKVKEDVKSSNADDTEAVAEKENAREEVKPAAMKRGLARTKPAETKKKAAKKAKDADAEPAPIGLDSDLFDAECDSDDDVPAVKPSPKTRASPRTKAGKQAKPDLSDLYDAEDDSDEDSQPTKKPRGRPKKDPKATAKSKKTPQKSNQPTLKRARMDDDEGADEAGKSEEMPEEEPVRAPKPVVPEGPRRKRVKKMVTKTHVNDVGEFVTEKVYETDSTDASDVEAAPVAKRLKIGVPNTPNLAQHGTSVAAGVGKTGKKLDAKKPAGKGKQSSLTSFFKK